MSERKVGKNTIYSIIKSCSSVIFPLITFPYISRVLLTENVGKVNFGNSVVSYFSLLASLGITTYAVRECSKVKNDKLRLEKLSSEIISINILTTIVSYLVLFFVLLFAKPLQPYRLLIIIQSTVIIFTTLGADWLNTTMEDFKYITIRTFCFQLLSLILMFIFVKNEDDYLKYALITVVASSGGNIANIIYRKKYCATKFTLSMNIKKHFPPIMMLFAMILSQQIFVNSDTTILGILRGDYEVGLYSTSVKIYNIINTVISSIAWVVMPQLSNAFSKNDYIKVNNLLRYSIGFNMSIGLPCAVGMGMLAQEIIYIIAGPAYYGAEVSLRILSIAMAISLFWGIVMNMILLPAGKDKPCLWACVISAIVNIVLNLFFIPRWGYIAASITTMLSQVIGFLICIPFVDRRITIQNKKGLLLGPIIGCIVIAAYLMVCKNILYNTYAILLIGVLGSFILYFIVQILLKNDWITEIINNIKNKHRRGNI